MKTYLFAGLFIAFIAFTWGMINVGKKLERNAQQTAIIKYQQKEAKLIAELEEERKKRKVIYRDKIKIIEKASDACLDTKLPKSILDSLRNDSPG